MVFSLGVGVVCLSTRREVNPSSRDGQMRENGSWEALVSVVSHSQQHLPCLSDRVQTGSNRFKQVRIGTDRCTLYLYLLCTPFHLPQALPTDAAAVGTSQQADNYPTPYLPLSLLFLLFPLPPYHLSPPGGIAYLVWDGVTACVQSLVFPALKLF